MDAYLHDVKPHVPVHLQVELAAALSLPMLAGPPAVHSALNNRWTAKSIFTTAGVESPPGFAIVAELASAGSHMDTQLPAPSGPSDLHELEQLSSLPGTAGHAHCSACHPSKPAPFLAEYEKSEEMWTPVAAESQHAVESRAPDEAATGQAALKHQAASTTQQEPVAASGRVLTTEPGGLAAVAAASSPLVQPGQDVQRVSMSNHEGVIAAVRASCNACSGSSSR